jgi:hypothetical protein
MKVKMLTGLVGTDMDPVKPGETVDLPKHVAEAYIAAGSAEKVTQKRARKTEKATQPTAQAERATTLED